MSVNFIGGGSCAPDVEQLASKYRAALQKATQFIVSKQSLVLKDPTGIELATFSPALSSLVGTNWNVISYNNGKHAVITLINGTTISARFGNDGHISGNASCNSYSVSYTQTNSTVVVATPATTRRLCMKPNGIMDQENLYLKALPTATQFQIKGNRLQLRNSSGALVTILVSNAN
jgi:heat shock protein HslJ